MERPDAFMRGMALGLGAGVLSLAGLYVYHRYVKSGTTGRSHSRSEDYGGANQVFMAHEERRLRRAGWSDRALPMVLITGFLGSGKVCRRRIVGAICTHARHTLALPHRPPRRRLC